MKIRSNYDFYSVEEREQDAKEMVNLLKMERLALPRRSAFPV